jgi:hypothetical protein
MGCVLAPPDRPFAPNTTRLPCASRGEVEGALGDYTEPLIDRRRSPTCDTRDTGPLVPLGPSRKKEILRC